MSSIVINVRLTLPAAAAAGYHADQWYPMWQASLAGYVKSTLRELGNDDGDAVVPTSVEVEVTGGP